MISTVSPSPVRARSCAWTTDEPGSTIAACSLGMPAGDGTILPIATLSAGIATYSARPPGHCCPISRTPAESSCRPSMQYGSLGS